MLGRRFKCSFLIFEIQWCFLHLLNRPDSGILSTRNKGFRILPGLPETYPSMQKKAFGSHAFGIDEHPNRHLVNYKRCGMDLKVIICYLEICKVYSDTYSAKV